GVIEVVIGARDQDLYSAITDCGAGGLSSAVGELGRETGVDVDLASVRLKYPGLAPWEVWLSEAQERMVLAVPQAQVSPLQALCDRFDVELTDIGQFTGTGRLVVRYRDVTVVDLDMRFVHEGMPRRRLTASRPISAPRIQPDGQSEALRAPRDFKAALLKLLSHPNTASKQAVIRLFDHEVQGGTVVKPLTGARDDGPSDAAVIKPQGTRGPEALVIACGGNPEIGKVDAYAMAVSAVDEAVRNAVAVGADPDRIALLDNFCWGDPNQPEILGSLVEAARGCHDAAVHYGTPFISGKDSLNNEYTAGGQRVAIPGTLIVSAVGLMADLRQVVTMDLKTPGDLLYVLGLTRNELAGSHYRMVPGGAVSSTAAPSLPLQGREMMRALHRAIRAGLVRACHDCSEGGLAVALAEMCIAGRLGCLVDLSRAPAEGAGIGMDSEAVLFSESNGRFVVEVAAEATQAFEQEFQGLPWAAVGQVAGQDVRLHWQGDRAETTEVLTAGVDELARAWNGDAAL
ncbi:MAG: AIR synthase-related protein, partial [Chloroflexota bacterium]|nr:AIR synthase-related protein [Chloroflexota bacterium]